MNTNQFQAKFRLFVTGGGVFQPSLNNLSRKISGRLGLDPNGKYFEHRIRIEWQVQVKPWLRFSKVGRLYSQWFEYVKNGLVQNFSTDALITPYK